MRDFFNQESGVGHALAQSGVRNLMERRLICFNAGSGNTMQGPQTDARIALTDEAKLAEEGSTQATDNATVQNITGPDANIGGLSINGTQGEVHIESVDPAVVSRALESVEHLASTTLASASNSADKTNKLLADLAESKQTEGAAKKDQAVLLIALARLALAGVGLFGGKK